MTLLYCVNPQFFTESAFGTRSNDITKHYKEIIDNINAAIDWASSKGMHVVYIKHNNLSSGTRTFKPNTKGAELVPEMKILSENIFLKNQGQRSCK